MSTIRMAAALVAASFLAGCNTKPPVVTPPTPPVIQASPVSVEQARTYFRGANSQAVVGVVAAIAPDHSLVAVRELDGVNIGDAVTIAGATSLYPTAANGTVYQIVPTFVMVQYEVVTRQPQIGDLVVRLPMVPKVPGTTPAAVITPAASTTDAGPTKAGAGTLTLSGASTYTGGTVPDVSKLQPAPAAAAAPADPKVKAVMTNVHENLEKMGGGLGGLNDDEKTKLADLEKGLEAKVTANPAMADSPSFRDDVMKQFAEILTPDHQTKFGEMMGGGRARMAEVQTGARLHLMGVNMMLYATQHDGALPPDLGTLAAQDKPENFLAGGSKTQVPTDLDAAKQVAWVNENSDFAYLGAGKKQSELAADFVVAYDKTGDTRHFLTGDFRTLNFSGEKATKIADELKAGTNPPPTLAAASAPVPDAPKPDLNK